MSSAREPSRGFPIREECDGGHWKSLAVNIDRARANIVLIVEEETEMVRVFSYDFSFHNLINGVGRSAGEVVVTVGEMMK